MLNVAPLANQQKINFAVVSTKIYEEQTNLWTFTKKITHNGAPQVRLSVAWLVDNPPEKFLPVLMRSF
ncbi:hypothetical protein T265_03754 [Opisthorchis viverrini]|uniref:Uncharacterized protein n=1 Tax=Opisthorchis viverrini TaxID=6198 RepID=A0A074ZQG1_OPIVI|nr:hypothetical protein T265_03754 [Opisthorchis viverrini]KER29643.1 hypothetical protein T265_03754 [Opisthorchis viverrini]